MAVYDIGRVAEVQVDAGKPQRRQAGGVFRQADRVVRVEPIDHLDPKLFERPPPLRSAARPRQMRLAATPLPVLPAGLPYHATLNSGGADLRFRAGPSNGVIGNAPFSSDALRGFGVSTMSL